jgi:hypothetical protein
MRKFWPFIYFGSAVPCVIGGYESLLPEHTAGTNADWIFVTITFVTTCLFPLGAMAYSRRRGVETFRKPSLDRHPLGWWSDTLQPLRVSWVLWHYMPSVHGLLFRGQTTRASCSFCFTLRWQADFLLVSGLFIEFMPSGSPNTALELTAMVAFRSAIAACVFTRRSPAFGR